MTVGCEDEGKRSSADTPHRRTHLRTHTHKRAKPSKQGVCGQWVWGGLLLLLLSIPVFIYPGRRQHSLRATYRRHRMASTLCMGIHIGDTMCSVCVYKNGTLDVIANEQGSRTTPACIAFTEVETLLGEPARGQLVRNAQSVVVDGMRLLGRRFDDESFQAECALWKFPISCGGKDGNSPQVEVSVNGKATTFTPPRLLALLLARLQRTLSPRPERRSKKLSLRRPHISTMLSALH